MLTRTTQNTRHLEAMLPHYQASLGSALSVLDRRECRRLGAKGSYLTLVRVADRIL